MACAPKLGSKTVPLTGMVPPEVLINGAKNTIVYGELSSFSWLRSDCRQTGSNPLVCVDG